MLSLLKNTVLALLLVMTCLHTVLLSQQLLDVDEVKFKFKGKRSFEDSQLKDAVAISKASLYKKEIVGEDILKLKKFYFDNGFFDTEIDTAVSIDYDDEEAIVTFIITENNRYKIDSVVIKGVQNVSQEALTKI